MKHLVFVEASATGAGEIAVQRAKHRGYRVTLLTRAPETQPIDIIQHCDVVESVETNDFAALAEAVRLVNEKFPIDGVTTTADWYVPQAAEVCHQLNLPGMKPHAAHAARNKLQTRLRLQKTHPELNPRFAVAGADDAWRKVAEWNLPFIAKPQNADGGEGVKLIASRNELTDYMDMFASWHRNAAAQLLAREVLLEEFIAGDEFSVETVQAVGGPLQLIGVTRKHLTGAKRGRFVEAGHAFPEESNVEELLFQATQACLEAMEIDCGVIHTECRLTADGQIKIMEVNPRLAGDKIGSHLVEIATGVSALDAVIDVAIGEPVNWQPRLSRGAALRFIYSDRDAIFAGVLNREELLKMPGVLDIFDVAIPGTRAVAPESNKDRLAVIVSEAESANEAYDTACRAASRAEFLQMSGAS